jgi:putative ATPase
MPNARVKAIKVVVGVKEVVMESVVGDITEERVDAIVNAANENLVHGGGLALAIVRKGGKVIQEESLKVAPVPTGSAGITGAGSLPCKYVIHAVGPVWRGGDNREEELLASAVKSALQVAMRASCKSISIPAISCGIFGFPVEKACPIIVNSAYDFVVNEKGNTIELIRFCNLDPKIAQLFGEALTDLVNKHLASEVA